MVGRGRYARRVHAYASYVCTAWCSAVCLPSTIYVSTLPLKVKTFKSIQLRMMYCTSNSTAFDGDWTAPDEAQARDDLSTEHDDGQKTTGPGRELNPGPPPDDHSPKKESYY